LLAPWRAYFGTFASETLPAILQSRRSAKTGRLGLHNIPILANIMGPDLQPQIAMSDVVTKNAQRDFTVVRDDAGVPNIQATTWLDALYGLGYMHATDRGTQLLFSRTVASGRAAELIADKDELLETDRFFRRIGLHLNLDREVDQMDRRTHQQVTVYCAGVNDGIRAKRRSLPMWATGYQPEKWDPQAVLLVGRLLSFGGLAVSQMQNERLIVELIKAGANEAALAEMFEPRLDSLDFDLMREVNISNRLSDQALELIVDLPRLAGSNAWAVSPERSATGHALLASDPHLEVNRLPAIWYEAVLRWDSQYVMGATLPGFPLFSVGRNPKLSWGVTYMKGDTIDYFVEDCRCTEDGAWQFRREDQWQNFTVREESLKRKNNEPVPLRVYENEIGTLDADVDETGEGKYLSIAWAGRRVDASTAVSTWLDLIQANDVTTAMDVVSDCPQPTLSFVFADAEGHIGQQACGAIPKRSNPNDGLAPLPAWDPKNHWQGWLPKELLPSIYDPPEGFVATANEECNPEGGPLVVTQTVHDYRVRRIQEQLSQMPQATIKDMQKLQYDVVSKQAEDLLAMALPFMQEGPLKEILSNWNYSYAADSSTAPVFQAFYRNLMFELLGNKKGLGWRRILYLCSRAGFSSMILTAADRLLQKQDSWWWHGRDKAELIRSAADAVELGTIRYWSEMNNFHFANRFLGGNRVGRLLGYNTRQHAMPGNHATPFQGHVFQTATRESTFAPSYHFVTDMGTNEAWTNLPGGPSESRFSKYYRSDIPLWLDGEYKRLGVTT
jgi:penicillin amidase